MRQLKPETELRNLKRLLKDRTLEAEREHRRRLDAESNGMLLASKVAKAEIERDKWQERFDTLLERVPIAGFVRSSDPPASLSLTEQAVMSAPVCSTHGNPMHNWRNFRIEYGFECACPEGVIWAPKHIDPDALEAAIAEALR